MAQAVPSEFRNSRAMQFVLQQGWNWKQTDSQQIELEYCPYKECKKGGYGHFYMVCSEDGRDGLFNCHRCGNQGPLRKLKEYLGLAVPGVMSLGDKTMDKTEVQPNMDDLHTALLADEDAMDYLVNVRGFSADIIKKTKLGLTRRYFRELGEVRALVYPYFVGNNCVFWHYRSLPPAQKAFNSPKGWDARLYNGEIVKEGLPELIMVEGEANCIAAMDNGIEAIVGVPGANFKKADWIEQLDKAAPEKIYICYDSDKVGQKAAQNLASKVGIDKCWKIVLPDFEFTDPITQEFKKGKDLNEWFVHGGGSVEIFEQLKQSAELFDVQGVVSPVDALDEVEDLLNNKTSLMPKYQTPWAPLNKLIGFEEADIIDIVAPEKIGKTTFGINLMEHMIDTYNEDGVIICLEMPVVRLARKWVSHVTGTPDPQGLEGEAAVRALEEMKLAVRMARAKATNRDSKLYFCYPQITNVDDVYTLIRECIRRYGVKWVMLDNIQLLCDRTLGKNMGYRTIHLSQISKTLAGIAKDNNVQVIRILQPHRIREGAMITTDDVDGASQIAKDCDCMITLHRARKGQLSAADVESMGYVESSSAFEPKMTVTVGLSRYTSGGYTTLDYDGPTSTVTEFDIARIATMKQSVVPQTYEQHNKVLNPKEEVITA